MSPFFLVLVGIAALMVLASLFLGIFAMARGGEKGNQDSQKFMRARVLLQGLALLFFVIAIFAGKN